MSLPSDRLARTTYSRRRSQGENNHSVATCFYSHFAALVLVFLSSPVSVSWILREGSNTNRKGLLKTPSRGTEDRQHLNFNIQSTVTRLIAPKTSQNLCRTAFFESQTRQHGRLLLATRQPSCWKTATDPFSHIAIPLLGPWAPKLASAMLDLLIDVTMSRITTVLPSSNSSTK